MGASPGWELLDGETPARGTKPPASSSAGWEILDDLTPTKATPDEDDPILRFLSRLWGHARGAGASAVSGAGDFVSQPTSWPRKVMEAPFRGAQAVSQAASAGAEDQYTKMFEAARRAEAEPQTYALGKWQLPGEEPQMALPRPGDREAMWRAIAGTLPVAGPYVAGKVEQVGGGQAPEAVGDTLYDLLLGKLFGKAAGRIGPKSQPTTIPVKRAQEFPRPEPPPIRIEAPGELTPLESATAEALSIGGAGGADLESLLQQMLEKAQRGERVLAEPKSRPGGGGTSTTRPKSTGPPPEAVDAMLEEMGHGPGPVPVPAPAAPTAPSSASAIARRLILERAASTAARAAGVPPGLVQLYNLIRTMFGKR